MCSLCRVEGSVSSEVAPSALARPRRRQQTVARDESALAFHLCTYTRARALREPYTLLGHITRSIRMPPEWNVPRWRCCTFSVNSETSAISCVCAQKECVAFRCLIDRAQLLLMAGVQSTLLARVICMYSVGAIQSRVVGHHHAKIAHASYGCVSI